MSFFMSLVNLDNDGEPAMNWYCGAVQIGPDDDEHIWLYVELKAESLEDAKETLKESFLRPDVKINYVELLEPE